MAARLVFLGTGASGGTPGSGRSLRRESSLLARAGATILIDATRDLSSQLDGLDRLDAVLLTHAHRDASGGIPSLRGWLRARHRARLEVLASRATITRLRERYARLEHCEFVPVDSEQTEQVGGWRATPLEVPHAHHDRFPTYAWRLTEPGTAFVYASDVAELTAELRRFSQGANVLVIDGAMYGRSISVICASTPRCPSSVAGVWAASCSRRSVAPRPRTRNSNGRPEGCATVPDPPMTAWRSNCD